MLSTVMPYASTIAAKLPRREEGATLVEYGLLLALIAAVCIGAITVLGGSIDGMFDMMGTTIGTFGS